MALNDTQMEALKYMLSGMSTGEIAPLVGVDRSTVWRWSKTKEWKEAYKDMQQEIKSIGEDKILKDLDTYIAKLKGIALDDKTPIKLKADTLIYLIDRVLGKASNKNIDILEPANKEDISVNLEQELENFKAINFENQN